jgi:hypothetical protein
MIELANHRPQVEVQLAEYQRMLGYPADRVLDERASELVAASREWYDRHGRPWIYARHVKRLEIAGDTVRIEGTPFVSFRLAKTLRDAGAESVIVVAASAGGELEREAQRLWQAEKPDEYFFLEVFGSAVVEHLITMKGAELCAWAEAREHAILPHYSPGYPEWDIAQQPALLQLIRSKLGDPLPGELDVLDSGMLRPKKSLLAVFGITPHVDRVGRLTDLNPCERCSYQACQFRRAPYQQSPRRFNSDEIAQTTQLLSQLLPATTRLDRNARYSVNTRALARWTGSRLRFTHHESGTLDASFHYEGTTCSNLGRPLHFDYQVTLGPREEGYVISGLGCRPSPGNDGYTSMCRYLEDAASLMTSIEREKPLLGEPLNRILTWSPPQSAAGCHCELADRLHKWRLVLETIHYALVQQERLLEVTQNGFQDNHAMDVR